MDNILDKITPGDLILARGREWIALPSSDAEVICLRPLSGSEDEIQYIRPELEIEQVKPAHFPIPSADIVGTQDSARLFSEALRLSMRRGAGPFRSASRLAFEPRAYQLVPLLMALRHAVVRLLIADDVGIGKTIEAGLILREFIDRGEVDRFSILCPPHLVEQWVSELKEKFDLDAVAVTSSSASKLERGLLDSQSLFDAHPHTVVSLDYIKADKRRDNFSRACPSFIIVDEAHSCVGTHKGKQQRFDLLSRLANDENRHIVLLTATPHSGDEEAFQRLLSLLSADFAGKSFEDQTFRERLAQHFVQRRRIDITGQDWGENGVFARHETKELAYKLDSNHTSFHEAVLDYCLEVVQKAGSDQRSQRLAFWGTLALMRCVGSSPLAALNALRNRAGIVADVIEDQVYDEDTDEAEAFDIEPQTGLTSDASLSSLIKQAESLLAQEDPKVLAVIKELKPIIKEGGNPVVFCRYLATADYLGDALRKAFPRIRVEVVTGTLTPEERRARVEQMAESDQRLLVATDCLSEGINLQSMFDAVIHYDLSWNPTRHQQREGRVDRYGQKKKLVRSVLLFSPDSSIDGAVLDVILRKAEAIKKTTGVTVPLPEERSAVTSALMNAVLLRKGSRVQQLSFLPELVSEAKAFEEGWKNAEEGEKRSRARFAQNAFSPQSVIAEWNKWQELVGTQAEVKRFIQRAMSRLNAPLEPQDDSIFKAPLSYLPHIVQEKLESRNIKGTQLISFSEAALKPGVQLISRSHPLLTILAETLLEGALDPTATVIDPLGRASVWLASNVDIMQTVALLRLRYKITVHARKQRTLLVEEAQVVSFSGNSKDIAAAGPVATALLELPAVGDLADNAKKRSFEAAVERIRAALPISIADFAKQRAEQLTADHNRVRDCYPSKVTVAKVTVEPFLPVDVMGLFVIVPAGA